MIVIGPVILNWLARHPMANKAHSHRKQQWKVRQGPRRAHRGRAAKLAKKIVPRPALAHQPNDPFLCNSCYKEMVNYVFGSFAGKL
jgi:hypothetical protein